MNIVYSSDDNYAQHTGVSIISLLENNKHFNEINIYIVDNDIKNENKIKLNNIANRYKRKITYIDFKKYKEKLKLNMEWDISISSYARLFLTSMLPESIERVLYFDCDSVINQSLDELWNENIDNYYIAAVQDTVSNSIKKSIGMDKTEKYINAGMLLINLKKMRENNIEKKFLEFIDKYNGNVIHHDQGVINGVLHGHIKIISPKFNFMTVLYTMSRDELIKYYNIQEDFYSVEEIENGKERSVFIHFTPGFTTRPWVKGCTHPFKELYWNYLRMTPWNGVKLEEDKRKISQKIVSFIYEYLPFKIANKIIK